MIAMSSVVVSAFRFAMACLMILLRNLQTPGDEVVRRDA
jgi:hypothetical protein